VIKIAGGRPSCFTHQLGQLPVTSVTSDASQPDAIAATDPTFYIGTEQNLAFPSLGINLFDWLKLRGLDTSKLNSLKVTIGRVAGGLQLFVRVKPACRNFLCLGAPA
jgi:hypothetical protein